MVPKTKAVSAKDRFSNDVDQICHFLFSLLTTKIFFFYFGQGKTQTSPLRENLSLGSLTKSDTDQTV